MKHKIIVADDSLTIQKVIKITLAKEDFELIECLEDHKLLDLCREIKPTLVLLDFNLSENKTGYDLCQEIKKSDVDKILMLYGTFDTVDENLLDHCGANGHIVKPFEGNKFVSLCRQLIDDADSSDDFEAGVISEPVEIEIPEPIAAPEVNLDDQWVMNQPESSISESDKTDEHDMSNFLVRENENDQLREDVSDWGIDIPNIIDASTKNRSVELPPIIGSEPSFEEEYDELPVDTDLEYPNVEAIRESVKSEPAPKAKLIPLAELQESNEPLEIGLDDTLGTKTEDEVRALEEQIANETEEDLWAADDEVEAIKETFVKAEEPQVFAHSTEPTLSREEVLEALESQIEAIVNSRVEAIIEKVAWEVIPDLAENLISKELKNLASSVND